MEWIKAFLPALLGAILTAMGMGGGGVLLIYLTAVLKTPQLTAQGINLLFFLPIAVVSLIIHVKNKLVKFKIALFISLFGFLGVMVGSRLAMLLPGLILRRIFSVLLLVIGVRELISAWRGGKTEK